MSVSSARPQRRLPKRSKTIPLRGNPIRGDGRDHGKYYHCWVCGFICDVDRDELGGPDSRANITPTAYTHLDDKGVEVFHCQGAHGKDEAACVAAGGTWSSTRYSSVVNSACPVCGSPNWRGDY